MAYLGQSNSLYDPTRTTPKSVQTFSGNGSTLSFTLLYSVFQSVDIEVLVENVVQQPDYAYTAIGNTLTFTSPPPVGTNNIYVRFDKITGLTGTVPDGSVTSSKLANNIRLLATDMYTGTGSQTAFNLSDTPADANSLIVSVNGVSQAAPTNYTVSGSTITFTSAPDAGANVVIRNVGFRTTQTLYAFPSGTQMVQPVITGGSANNMTLTNATITGGSANGIMYVNSSNTVTSGSGLVFDGTNVGIGTSSPGSKLDVVGNANIKQFISAGNGTTNGYLGYSWNRNLATGALFDNAKNAYDWIMQPGSNNLYLEIYAPGGSPVTGSALVVDTLGNLGVGVTPKNSYGPVRSLEIGPSSSALFGGFASSTNLQTWVANNTYSDGVADRYAVTGSPASMFRCVNGIFDWRSTGSTTGTAGGTATLNTFMTLDASGKLMLDAITFGIGGGTSPAIYRTGVNGSGIHFTTNGGIPTNETGTISDNTESWGTAAWRWSVIYAATGTINTSDRNEKQDIADLTSAELAVAIDLKRLFKTFRWKDAVSKKGDEARIHVGVIAQDVWDAFTKQGLDPSRYALWCEDNWYEVDGQGMDSNSVPYTAESEGAVKVTRYGIRYDQLLAFILSAL